MADASTVTPEAVATTDPLTQVAVTGEADPLGQLADVHLPDAVGLWPLAPGWWLVIVVLVVAAVLLGRRLTVALLQQRIRQHALGELDKALAGYRAVVTGNAVEKEKAKLNYVNEINSVL